MKKLYLIIFGIIGLVTASFIYNHQGYDAKTALTPDQQQIQKTGYKCLDFGDRAVAKDMPIIEFQKLERISKRANVIARCMQDNGYNTNPVWLKYAEPIAKTEAEKTKISFDEAITNLSRKDMQVFEQRGNKPNYWVKNNVSKSPN
ncbi:MAG: hypothetical protein H0W85_08455 [Methylotenera sp.]|nr:hypothetical protein [Methylotenera sp.]